MNKLQKVVLEIFPNVDWGKPETLTVGGCKEWDSLGHFNLLMAIEEEFGIRFTLEEISESKSLDQITLALTNRGISL